MNGKTVLRCGAAALAFCATPVLAQSAGAGAPVVGAQTDSAKAQGDTGLQDIIVTAQKRAQNIQDVPGSVSSIGAEQLQLTGSRNVQDLVSQTPGLVWGTVNGGSFITLRGVGLSVDTGVAEPNVALHVDGVFIPRSTIATLDATDLGRVEVLRGPQGTLYGRNATGGAINLISQAPTAELSGAAALSYGNYNTFGATGYISGPLAQGLRGRLSATFENRADGYAKNLFTGRDLDKLRSFNIRGAIQADLSDRLTMDLSAQYQHQRFQTYQQAITPVGPIGFFLFPGLVTGVTPTQPRRVGNNYEPDSTKSTFIARLGLSFDLTDDIQLKSTTGYINATFHNALDGDGSSVDAIRVTDRTQPSKSISQEFNLSGKTANDKLNWLVGAYFFHEDFQSTIPVPFPLGIPGVLPPSTVVVSSIFEKTRSLAAFTDLTYSVTKRFRVYAGARVSNDLKNERQTAGAIIAGLPLIGCQDLLVRQDFKSFSPRIGVQFDVADHVMSYGQFQKGFKSGGLNSSSCGNIYAPEKLDAIEFGVKSSLLDRHLILNASLFHYKYKDLQLFQFLNAAQSRIDNADARTYGAEIEAQAKLTDILRVDVGATFLDPKYTKFISVDPTGVQTNPDQRGHRLDRAPRYAVTVAPQLTFPAAWANFDHLVLRADVKFSGDYYFRPYNTAADRQKPFQTVDISTALVNDHGLTVRGFVRNLTGQDIISHEFYVSSTNNYVGTYLPPRTFGVEVRFSL